MILSGQLRFGYKDPREEGSQAAHTQRVEINELMIELKSNTSQYIRDKTIQLKTGLGQMSGGEATSCKLLLKVLNEN